MPQSSLSFRGGVGPTHLVRCTEVRSPPAPGLISSRKIGPAIGPDPGMVRVDAATRYDPGWLAVQRRRCWPGRTWAGGFERRV
jgi:hypothetical protein